MRSGEARNAALSRAALLAAAGGTLIGLTQQAPELALGAWGKGLLVVGAAVVVAGLILAIRTLTARSGGADQ